MRSLGSVPPLSRPRRSGLCGPPPICSLIPLPVEVSLVDPAAIGTAEEPVSQILGFVPENSGQLVLAPSWLGAPVNWSVLEPQEAASSPPNAPITWMLFIRLPESLDEPALRQPDGGRERAIAIRIGRERFPVRLAQLPGPMPIGRISAPEAGAGAWRDLGDMLAVEAQDPTRRWRVSLLTERFTAQRLFGTDSLAERAPLGDPVLSGVGETFEAEWRSAISAVEQTDPELAAQLLARITAITKLPNGTLLPVWPTDGEAEGTLLPQLLSRSLTEPQRLDALRAYLQNQPPARTAVLDDAGRSLRTISNQVYSESGEIADTTFTAVGSTLVVTDVSSRSSTLTIGPAGEFDAELIRLEPGQSMLFSADVSTVTSHAQSRSTPLPSTSDATGSLVLRRDRFQSPIELRVVPLEVFGRGRTLGPALERHDLRTFNLSGARLAPPNWQTGILLYKDEQSGRWNIYVEARFPAGTSEERLQAERIDIYFGPYRGTDAVLSVTTRDEAAMLGEDRWSALLELPDAALNRAAREGTLAIGFARTDSRITANGEPGTTSWPRPLLPGEDEPGRFRLKLLDR